MELSQIAVGKAGASFATQGLQPAGDPGAALRGFAEALAEAEAQATASLEGKGDPHALVTAMAEGKLAIEMATVIRDRAVEAYQEILRMPV